MDTLLHVASTVAAGAVGGVATAAVLLWRRAERPRNFRLPDDDLSPEVIVAIDKTLTARGLDPLPGTYGGRLLAAEAVRGLRRYRRYGGQS
jgi:hypothetical protein